MAASTQAMPYAQEGKPSNYDMETEQCGGAVQKAPWHCAAERASGLHL